MESVFRDFWFLDLFFSFRERVVIIYSTSFGVDLVILVVGIKFVRGREVLLFDLFLYKGKKVMG